jgi:hypothetical protein
MITSENLVDHTVDCFRHTEVIGPCRCAKQVRQNLVDPDAYGHISLVDRLLNLLYRNSD